jgi:TatD DNase family protein
MKLFDSHCHLDDTAFEKGWPQVLERMAAQGVDAALIAGINLERSFKGLALAEKHPELYASVGVHPHDASGCSETALTTLAGLAGSPKVRAWGEIGLDFNRMYSPQAVQEKWFLRQLEIADSLGLPVILHERDSQGRLLELLHQRPNMTRSGVVHCFSGTNAELERYLKLGFYIGITGILTIQQRGRRLREQVSLIPKDRLLIETDAPYLTPAPQKNRHRRNEPAFVKSVLLKLAEVLSMEADPLADIIWTNTCTLFGQV